MQAITRKRVHSQCAYGDTGGLIREAIEDAVTESRPKKGE